MDKIIQDLGWYWDLHGAGGWTHDDVRDDDGARIPFDTAADVAHYLDISCWG